MNRKIFITAFMAFASLGMAALLRAQDNATTGSSPSQVPPPGSVVTRQPSIDQTNATIAFSTIPSVRASVTWGKTLLGIIARDEPLVIVRPRDSGPLDVMVRAKGYLPVQTRAYTFSDQNVVVKLTPIAYKSELLGYRVPLDAGVDQTPDAAQSDIQTSAPVNQDSAPRTEPPKPATSPPPPKSSAPSPPPPEKKPWYQFW
jgi:hypothetical protein